ncbi:MAG: ATP-dependent metallopeptidase FtsH/Yme1/Tma family protein, partial [Nodosilinea sp.]
MSMRFPGKQVARRPHAGVTATGLMTMGWFLLQSLMPLSAALADTKPDGLTYGQFLQKIDAGQVQKVDLDDVRGIAYVTLDGAAKDQPPEEVTLFAGDSNTELISRLRANDVDVEIRDSSSSGALAWLAT